MHHCLLLSIFVTESWRFEPLCDSHSYLLVGLLLVQKQLFAVLIDLKLISNALSFFLEFIQEFHVLLKSRFWSLLLCW